MGHPELERIAQTLYDRPFPKIFAVELTAECNLHCSMCHHPGMVRPKGRLPMPLWERCADQVVEFTPQPDVWFSFCGEPLLEPDRLFEMVEYGKKIGLTSINLNSNGALLTKELADRILDSGLSVAVFGIDGFEAETYEAMRCGAKRDEVYANVEYLLEARKARGSGPEIMVQLIVTDSNRDEVDAFRDHWASRGATLKIRNQLSWGGTIDTAMLVSKDERIPCPWAITMMHLFWDGRVPRCPGDTEGQEAAGNAWDESLVTLWRRLGSYRNIHLERRFDDLPERCQRCKDWMVGASVKVKPQGDKKLQVMVTEPTREVEL